MLNPRQKEYAKERETWAVLEGANVKHLKVYDIFELQNCIHPKPDLEGRTWMVTQLDKFSMQCVACPISEDKPNAVEITLLWPRDGLESQLLKSID